MRISSKKVIPSEMLRPDPRQTAQTSSNESFLNRFEGRSFGRVLCATKANTTTIIITTTTRKSSSTINSNCNKWPKTKDCRQIFCHFSDFCHKLLLNYNNDNGKGREGKWRNINKKNCLQWQNISIAGRNLIKVQLTHLQELQEDILHLFHKLSPHLSLVAL